MGKSKQYVIPFSGLKLGKHEFKFTAKKEFFDQYAFDEFNQIDTVAVVELEKLSTMMILNFNVSGTISTICDRCTDQLEVSFETEEKLFAKFGDGESEDENIVFLPQAEYQIDVSKYIYEYVITSISTSRVHEYEEDCNQDILKRISSMAVDLEEENNEEEINPMWAKLKELKNK